MYVIAHRGASEHEVDNSVAAFERAIDEGADFIETDIHRTADGVLVCAHDPMFNGKVISRSNFSELEGIASLEKLTQLAKGRTRLDIELKEEGYESDVVAQLRGSDAVVTSFSGDALARVKEADPAMKTGLITLGSDSHIGQTLKQSRADFLVAHHKSVNDRGMGDMLDEARAAGVEVWAWTVNDGEDLQELAGKVDGVITDRPAWARRELRPQLAGIGESDIQPMEGQATARPDFGDLGERLGEELHERFDEATGLSW
jgi:glycerophosphoryl diester phosphodiesterase